MLNKHYLCYSNAINAIEQHQIFMEWTKSYENLPNKFFLYIKYANQHKITL